MRINIDSKKKDYQFKGWVAVVVVVVLHGNGMEHWLCALEIMDDVIEGIE